VSSGSSPEKMQIEEDRLILFPDELQGDEYAHFQQLARSVKREDESIRRIEESRQTAALEAADKSNIDETVEFFDGIIANHYKSLLRSALYLREVRDSDQHFPEFNIDEEKRELKERYGYDAYYMVHLASSGYFDPNRFFRELYFDIEQEDGLTEQQYRDEFELIVGEKLIAVFVNSDDGVRDVKHDVRSAMAKHSRHNPKADFIDICGVGRECRETIDAFVELVDDEYPRITHERRDREEERVERLTL